MDKREECSLSWSERGTVAAIAAVCMMAMIMLCTLALDGAFVIRNKQYIQNALDMAALSGAKLVHDDTIDDDALEAKIKSAFVSNLATSKVSLRCDQTVSSFDRDVGTVTATVDCYFKPMLAGAIAPSSVKIAASSKTILPQVKIDVAMALDLSGSMGDDDMQDLRDAAKAAAATLIGSGKTGNIRVSFVGYGNAVNVGDYGPYVRGEIDSPPTSPDGLSWLGKCVSERIGDGAWDDRAPGTDAYFPEKIARCSNTGLFTLTSDLDAFDTAIDGLTSSGGTAGHLGVAWSWYLLSPKWASVWPSASEPLAYNVSNTAKVMIMMTDGQFSHETYTPNGTSSEQAVKLCEEMRSKKIRIYAVAFQALPEGQETLKKCAGQADRYFEVSSRAGLIAAYQDIAGSVIDLRIME